jgi:soluble lytic murein transglycosylase
MTGRKKLILVGSALALISAIAGTQHVNQEEPVTELIAEYIRFENESIDEAGSEALAQIIYDEAKRQGVDYRLVLAMMKVESNFKQGAVSHRGARGLLQVKPSLAKHMAKDAGVEWKGPKTLDEPETNVRIGVQFFSDLVEDFDSVNLALHAYNLGPTRLRQIMARKSPVNGPFARLVLSEYQDIASILPVR